MEIVFYCPIWGITDIPLDHALEKIKTNGYHGAEIAINPDIDDLDEIAQLFKKYELRMLIQHPFAVGKNPNDYLNDYMAKLEKILSLKPDKVNCHTGKDFFSIDDNLKIIESAEKLSESTQIPVLHETHRGRFSFSLFLTNEYIHRFPMLKLTADFSHWCVVSESLLENQQDILKKVFPHCFHIHARIGNAQSPQVNHPAAPENKNALFKHTEWWQSIYLNHRQNNQPELGITCEFGPMPYLPSIPFTNQPVASQWEINLFMKNYLQKQFALWEQKF